MKLSWQYRDSYHKDKKISWPSYLYNGNRYSFAAKSPQDMDLEFSCQSDISQASQQNYYWDTCQISEWYNDFKTALVAPRMDEIWWWNIHLLSE